MPKHTNLKKWWLRVFILLVLIMITVGGVTRLTRSGLSIVEWKPVAGIVPPLSEEEWQGQFELYQKSPEYQQVNSHFDIMEYKRIFLWEYLHRLLGRIIFLFALIPGLILYRKKVVSGKLVFLLSGLVAMQGLIGWLMVKSGLNLAPQVSPYMLALHFFSALIVLLTAHYHLSKIRNPLLVSLSRSQFYLLWTLGTTLAIQVFYGCLTSGWKAGFAFNTYPLMGGDFLPPGAFIQDPLWLNFFANPAMVQWVHRWMGILVFFALLATTISFLKSSARLVLRGPLFHLLGVTFLQIFLGVLNILLVVPTWLAAIHQLVAAMLIVSFCGIIFRLSPVTSEATRPI